MTDQSEFQNVQFNIATTQQNIAGNCYDFFVPGSVKLLLASRPQEELDVLTENNPRLFRYRCGFSATKAVRRQVIALQQAKELEDSAIRWQKYAGHILISRTDLRVEPSRLMPISGWIQLVIFTLICLSGFSQIAFANAIEWRQGLGLIFLALFWFAGAGALLKLYVLPWRTLKRVGLIASQ